MFGYNKRNRMTEPFFRTLFLWSFSRAQKYIWLRPLRTYSVDRCCGVAFNFLKCKVLFSRHRNHVVCPAQERETLLSTATHIVLYVYRRALFFIRWYFCCGIICAMIKLLKFIYVSIYMVYVGIYTKCRMPDIWTECMYGKYKYMWVIIHVRSPCQNFATVCMHALIILLLAAAYTRCRQIIWWLAHVHLHSRRYFVSIVRMWNINVGCSTTGWNFVSLKILNSLCIHLYIEVYASAFAPLERRKKNQEEWLWERTGCITFSVAKKRI